MLDYKRILINGKTVVWALDEMTHKEAVVLASHNPNELNIITISHPNTDKPSELRFSETKFVVKAGMDIKVIKES